MARIVDSTNQLASPRWAGDFGSPELGLMRGPFQVDAAQWIDVDYTITITEPATAGATSLTVAALPVAIPAGTFLQSGANEIVRVSANAAAGATALAVDAIGEDLEDNDTFTYTVTEANEVVIGSGTVVGRTTEERELGTAFGPAADGDDEIYITYFDILDARYNPDFVGYRPFAGRTVKQNYLPGFDDLDAAVVALLAARYILVIGHE